MENIDFLAIGETTIDAFIRLEDHGISTEKDGDNYRLCLPFATKIPYEFVEEVPAVGNASNAAVAASRLGLQSALVANVGNDADGKKCLDSLRKDNVSVDLIGIHDDKKTNYHYILWFKDDRTILQKHSDFPYKLPELSNPKWVYLTSLGESSLNFHDEIGNYLKNNPDVKLAFQPGIFQIKFGFEKIKYIYERTDIFFSNVEEVEEIFGIKSGTDIKEMLKVVKDHGPKIAVITDGSNGAYAYNGQDIYFIQPYPDPKPPYDRTGAGDAFASTFVAAVALGKPLHEALMWGPINSMSVVQEIGAQKGLLNREKLEEYLKNAPEDYKPKKI